MEHYKDDRVFSQAFDIKQLPSGKFCVNKIVLLCAMLAFNLLRTTGEEIIARGHLSPVKIKVGRWRLKTVLQNIVYSAVRVVSHAHGLCLHFGRSCRWYDLIADMVRSPVRL